MNKRICVLALLVALALTATIVFAELELVETHTRTNGETTVTWDSSFADFDYTLGATVTMTVRWTVDAGAATYESFDLRCPGNDGPNPLFPPGLSGLPDPPDPPGPHGKGCTNFTPRSKKDPADGVLLEPRMIDDSDDDDDEDGIFEGAVEVPFYFTELHSCPRRNVEMGNAHFKLYLNVDMDGDGEPDKVMSYGVNVHVEDPQ